MDYFLNFLSARISYWPMTAFIALLLAGLNVPISEDLIIILSAGICHENIHLLIPTLIAVYSGVVISDCTSYFLGFAISKGFLKFKWMQRMVDSKKTRFVMKRLERKRFATFITFRFFPFGFRNLLFLTSGFLHMNFLKFLASDCVAAFISNMTLFWLVFLIGKTGNIIVQTIGIALLLLVFIFIAIKAWQMKKEIR